MNAKEAIANLEEHWDSLIDTGLIDCETLCQCSNALEKQIQTEEAEIKDIIKKLDSKKEQLTVKDLKEFISELPDNMKIYIVSDDDMPVRKLVDISSETGPCYLELYLDTIEC